MTTGERWIRGDQVRVGDTIPVWWRSKEGDTVTGFRPYTGPLAHLWPQGVRIAEFMHLRSGMTFPHDDPHRLISRPDPVPCPHCGYRDGEGTS